jgi:hypothetical protein
MKQATLEDTLKRAQLNKQQEQQQQLADNEFDKLDEESDDDFEDLFPASGSGAKQAAASSSKAADQPASRKRSSAAAALAAAEASSGGSSSRKRKKTNKSAACEQQEAAEQFIEQLDLAALQKNPSSSSRGMMLDLSSKAAWQQLQQDLAVAEAVALGLLLCKRTGQAVQYYTSLQPLGKHQLQLLRKQARACRKAAASTAEDEDEGSVADTDLEVAGVALMPALQQPAGAPASNASSSRWMYFWHVPQQQQQPSQQRQQQQQQLPSHILQLLSGLLQDAGKQPCICSNAKVVLCCLCALGLVLPACQVSTLVDPELLAWMADPQLVQDSKQDSSKPTDCYSLANTLERSSLPVRP